MCSASARWYFPSRCLVGIVVCGVFVLIIYLQRTKWSTDLFTPHHRRHHHHHQRYHGTWNQIECDIVIHLRWHVGLCPEQSEIFRERVRAGGRKRDYPRSLIHMHRYIGHADDGEGGCFGLIVGKGLSGIYDLLKEGKFWVVEDIWKKKRHVILWWRSAEENLAARKKTTTKGMSTKFKTEN